MDLLRLCWIRRAQQPLPAMMPTRHAKDRLPRLKVFQRLTKVELIMAKDVVRVYLKWLSAVAGLKETR